MKKEAWLSAIEVVFSIGPHSRDMTEAQQFLSHLTLVDLVAVVAIVLSVGGALRGRRGLPGAVGAALGTAVVCWLIAAAVVIWGPAHWREVVRSSELVRLLPPPVVVIEQARLLVATIVTR